MNEFTNMEEFYKEMYGAQMSMSSEEVIEQLLNLVFNLKNKIGRANNVLSDILVIKDENNYRPIKNTSKQAVYEAIVKLNTILDTPYRYKEEKK